MKLTQIIATATTAAVLGTAGVSIAGATSGGGTSSQPKASATANASAKGTKRSHERRKILRGAIELAAKTIGIKPADLVKEVRAGKTIADVATAHNVTPQTVIDALVKAETDKINAAHTAGKLTDAQAAKLLAKLPDAANRFVNNKHDGKAIKAKFGKLKTRVREGAKLAAKTIGITPADLAKELKAGKTIADVATAHNVTPQTVIDALVKAGTDKINAAHTAGKLTDAQAAKLLERLPTVVGRFVNEWHPGAAAKK